MCHHILNVPSTVNNHTLYITTVYNYCIRRQTFVICWRRTHSQEPQHTSAHLAFAGKCLQHAFLFESKQILTQRASSLVSDLFNWASSNTHRLALQFPVCTSSWLVVPIYNADLTASCRRLFGYSPRRFLCRRASKKQQVLNHI
jgi:hypothetical protein